ncbi:Mss4-like protein [Xylariaceae sp. FL0016]|nr:Mss4-like protein [Xylariaceae sp. FL0016]
MPNSRIIPVKALPQRLVQGLRRHHPAYLDQHQHLHLHCSSRIPPTPCLHHRNTTTATFTNKHPTSVRSSFFHSTPHQYQQTANMGKDDHQEKAVSNGKDDHREKAASNGEDDWKNRPPYRTTRQNSEFEKKYTAHCHCGRVKYWLSREKPLAAKFCHCVDCQALHGAPFQWAAIFHKEDLHFENGAENLAFYHSSSKQTHYELPIKVSCSWCHAPIMDEGRNMVLMFPAIIKFGDAEHKKFFDPQCHIFYSQRVVDLPDGKPKWTGLDGSSKQMKECEKDRMESVVGKRKIEHVDE